MGWDYFDQLMLNNLIWYCLNSETMIKWQMIQLVSVYRIKNKEENKNLFTTIKIDFSDFASNWIMRIGNLSYKLLQSKPSAIFTLIFSSDGNRTGLERDGGLPRLLFFLFFSSWGRFFRPIQDRGGNFCHHWSYLNF